MAAVSERECKHSTPGYHTFASQYPEYEVPTHVCVIYMERKKKESKNGHLTALKKSLICVKGCQR